MAYLLANVADKTRVFLLPLVIVPFWTSILVRTFSWRVVLGQEGFVNETLLWLNVIDDPLTLVGNRMGTLVGMVHILLPFMIFPIFAVMRGIPNELMRAAENLGAGPFMAFWRVYFPLTLPGLGAGILLVFILSLGFFITPALLGGPGDQMISNVIEQQIRQAFNWEFASALAFLLLIATIILYLIYARFMSFDRLYGEQR
jgi:ABC-type spermidine/putrescine transport system permease subunit I